MPVRRPMRYYLRRGLRFRNKLFGSRSAFYKSRTRKWRSMMSKKNARKEIKYTLNFNFQANLGAVSRTTVALSPLQITVGADRNQRIGNKVKFRYVLFDTWGECDGGALLNGTYRMIVWSPRMDFTTAQNAIFALDLQFYPNPHTVQTYFDKTFMLGNPTTNNATPTFNRNTFRFKRIFKFPRSVNFTEANALVNDPQDIMYVTLFNVVANSPAVNWSVRSKCTYIDV